MTKAWVASASVTCSRRPKRTWGTTAGGKCVRVTSGQRAAASGAPRCAGSKGGIIGAIAPFKGPRRDGQAVMQKSRPHALLRYERFFAPRRGDACHGPESLFLGPATKGTASKLTCPPARGVYRCPASARRPLAGYLDLQKPRVLREGLLCRDFEKRRKWAPRLS